MKKNVILFLVFISLFANTCQSNEYVSKSTYKITIKIGNDFSSSTGFVVNDDGYMITNYSILENSTSNYLVAKNPYGNYADIVGIKGYKDKNIAILKIKNYDKDDFLKLQNPNEIYINDTSYAYGYNQSINSGKIINILNKQNKLIQTSKMINKNNIGGPLVNKIGNVIGVSTKKDNLALHVKEIINILKQNNIKYKIQNPKSNDMDLMYYILLICILFLGIIVYFLAFKNQKKPKKDEFIILKPINADLPLIKCKDKIFIGRDVSCDIIISNNHVSRKHCIIEKENNIFKLKNLNPKNGTFVNRKRLLGNEEVSLNKDDEIILGSDKVIYEVKI